MGCLLALSTVSCGSSDPTGGKALPEPDVPEDPCGPGTMRQPGTADCVPVGPNGVADGFKLHASGWGWEAVRPASACSGSEIAVIGHSQCEPIDDCAAPFPPADADAVVVPESSPSTPPATLLAQALSNAPEGALIALDRGDYGALTIGKDVRLVGRCAEQVVMRGPLATDPKVVGLAIDHAKVELHSLTITGFGIGIDAQSGANVTLDRVVVSDNHGAIRVVNSTSTFTATRSVIEGPSPDRQIEDAIGLSAFYGAHVTLDGVDVRQVNWPLSAYSVGTEFLVRRSLVSFEQKPPFAAGLDAWRGAHARVEESAFFTTSGRLVAVGRVTPSTPPSEQDAPPANVEVVRSVLVQSGLPRDEHSAIDIWQGATLSFEDSTIRHQSYTAIGVSDATSNVKLLRSVIASEPAPAPNRSAVIVQDGGLVELDASALVGAQQIALNANGTNSSLVVNRSLVTGTVQRFLGDFSFPGGTGQAIAVAESASLSMQQSAVVDSEGVGIFGVSGARLHLGRSLVDLTKAPPNAPLGVGILLVGAALEMDTSTVRRNADTALAFDASAGLITGSFLYENAIGVRTSGGTELVEASAAPAAIVEHQAVLWATRFDDNQSASSTDPLPKP
jgi:hypothetical protein